MTAAIVATTEPTSLVAVHDQCSKLEAWADQCESIPELKDAGNKLAAIDEYLARTSTEGRSRVAAAQARLKIRIGKLLGPTTNGERNDLRPSGASEGSLTRHERSDFRAMADKEDVVEAVIAESTDEAPASHRKVMKAIRGERPIGNPDAPKKATENVRARENEARELARKGFSSLQIANKLGVTRDTVMDYSERCGFDIPADAAGLRHKKFDADRIVATLVHDLEGARFTLNLLDYSALDADRIEGWVDSLTESIRALNKLKTNLVKESTREER